MTPLMFRAPEGPAVWAGLLCVPVGGGPPVSRPRRELRSARRLEARPGPAAAHGHRSQALSARWAGCLKPPSPLLARARVGLKPLSPLRVRNGRFGAFFGRRGDAGFKVSLLGASSGVGGFSVATLSRLVREIVRPAWPDGGREREVVRPARSKHPKIGIFTLAGRTFSRKSRWRGGAGRVFSRQPPLRPGLGCSAAHLRLAAVGGFALHESL